MTVQNDGAANEWDRVNLIVDLPEVHECLQNFSQDATGDNGAFVVRAVLRASDALATPTATPTKRDDAKKARPPSDDEPWVVADDEGVRVTFRTEDAAWRWRNEYTDRFTNPTVTHEPATGEPTDATENAKLREALTELESIRAGIDATPALIDRMQCAGCGRWNPKGHPEGHGHEDDCPELDRVIAERRTGPRLDALIAKLAATKEQQ